MSYLRIVLVALALALPMSGSSILCSIASAAEEAETHGEDHKDEEGQPHEHDEAHEHDDGHDAEGDGHESGHGHEADMPPILSVDPGAAICNLLIFLGVFALLAKFVWPVILGGLDARDKKIASDLAGAEQANSDAKALLVDYEKKLADANTEAQSILAEARRDADANAAKIVEEAKAEAKRQADRALADIETAKKVALSDIAGQTSSLAMGVAKQVVGRELNADDHADLIRKALDEVPSNN